MSAVSCRIAPTIILVVCGSAIAASTQSPGGVSPGMADRIVLTEASCPTLSWQELPDATGYELVAYALPEGVEPAAVTSADIVPEAEVLYARVPGGATSWTPALDQCLAPDGSYVWFVRGIHENESGEETPGDWSDGLFFAVSAVPSREEVAEAMRVLRRFVGEDVTAGVERNEAAEATLRTTPTVSLGTAAARKSVPVAATAIRGHLTAPAGETYGVVGVVESPDGAGLAAANLAGGPDLVLDGSSSTQPDLLLSHDGLDRPSAVDQFFTIHNSGGGTLNLEVDGVIFGNGSGISDVDALALGGLIADEYATDGELAASGGTPVHWDNLSNVPADLADGDQDTTYTAGPGLVLEGSELSAVWPGTRWGRHMSTTLDSDGFVGTYTSIAIGNDGLGLISYADDSNGDLKVAHCDDIVCSSATTWTIDSGVSVGDHTSITIGADGLGLISYYDAINADLKVAHCNDLLCSTATTTTIDSGTSVGTDTSVTIGRDGLGIISYHDFANTALKVAHCNDVLCSTATTSTIDTTGNVGWYTSITIGSDGLALVSYNDVSNTSLKVAHCNDVACTSATTTTVDNAASVGWFTSITIGSDGLGLISYFDSTNADLKAAHCDDVACSSATASAIDTAGTVGWHTSITVASDGLGVISYYRFDTGNLKIARCRNVTCSQASSAGVDSAGDVGTYSSITIGPDGMPLVSYEDTASSDLKVVHCSNRFCIPHVRYR